MTGNKEAYFYLASSLEKIFPDDTQIKVAKKRSTHNFNF